MRTPVIAYALNVPSSRREVLLHNAQEYWQRPVTEPVPTFSHPKKTPLVVFASFEDGNVTHIADGNLGSRAGTALVKLELHDLEELTRPFSFLELKSGVPARISSHLGRYLQQGGALPPKTCDAFVALMVKADVTAAERLSRLEPNDLGLQHLRTKARENLALQKDAVGIALRIAGIKRDHQVEWQSQDDAPRSFLEGMPEAIVREDAMIVADFVTLPGFEAIRGATHIATRSFQSETDASNRMTIIMANRLPLEQQTGADLIYYSEKYRSFVMVQYKAMRGDGGQPEFRWQADDQFARELERMETLWKAIEQAGIEQDPAAFRFSNNPFFLKFCPRVVFEPDDQGLFKGMYLPLDLWNRLRQSGRLKGPRGGNVVTFQNVRRAISNTEFVNLLSKAWVGTSIAQSAMLATMIREVLETGKTITIAVKHEADEEDGDVPADPSPSADSWLFG